MCRWPNRSPINKHICTKLLLYHNVGQEILKKTLYRWFLFEQRIYSHSHKDALCQESLKLTLLMFKEKIASTSTMLIFYISVYVMEWYSCVMVCYISMLCYTIYGMVSNKRYPILWDGAMLRFFILRSSFHRKVPSILRVRV